MFLGVLIFCMANITYPFASCFLQWGLLASVEIRYLHKAFGVGGGVGGVLVAIERDINGRGSWAWRSHHHV